MESDYDWSIDVSHFEDNEEELTEVSETAETDTCNKDLPKRVIMFTSYKLLKLLSLGKKASVDGTFKCCPKLWKQQFVMMVKQKDYWTPVVWAVLPDKSEESYRVFFLMLLKKMAEYDLEFNVKYIICDFEINILKSIDGLLKVRICGCIFHFRECF